MAVRIVLDPKEIEEALAAFKTKYLFEIQLWTTWDFEDVVDFASRTLEELGCGEDGVCVFKKTHFYVTAFVYSAKFVEEVVRVLIEEGEPPEEYYPDVTDVVLAVAAQKAKPGAVYEFMGQIADRAQDIGVAPVVKISVSGNRKALEKLRRRFSDVKSKLFDDRLVLYPTFVQWLDRELYRRLFGGLLAELINRPQKPHLFRPLLPCAFVD
jgi:hypothetical protein